MATDTQYKEFILENVIKQILTNGDTPTIELIDSMYNSLVIGKDFTQPQFDNVAAEVASLESASAQKYNDTNKEIWIDLDIAYQSTIENTKNTVDAFDRWRSEAVALEGKLKSLDARITNLLSTQLNKNAYYITEVFHDTTQVDLSQTSAYVNLNNNNVLINTSDNNPNKINLNYLSPDNITFTVLSRQALQNVSTAPGADLINTVNDTDNFWQSRIYVSSNSQPITTELVIKLSDSGIAISKISCDLHCANTNSAIQITPLTSTDGINFTQLNTNNITVSVTDNGFWVFPSITVTHVKFVMTKAGFDFIDGNSYIYEFGMEDISFYNLSFDTEFNELLISNSLFVPDKNDIPIPYHSATLTTCDDIPSNTNILYYLAALQNEDDTPVWVPVSSVDGFNLIYPNTINFGDKQTIELKNVMISFDTNGNIGFINPGANFTITNLVSDNVVNTVFTASNTRYILSNSNDRVLNYEIDGNLTIVNDSVKIFRNVGARGDTLLVRGIQRGWSFSDPYYSCAFEIKNTNGVSIDFGQQSVIIDNVQVNGVAKIATGIHTIKITKNNWVNVPAGIVDVTVLKATALYPYNHKLLIEGYTLNDPQNIYQGADTFAGYYMNEISIVDFISSAEDNDYTVFATDIDAPIVGKDTPSTVFVIKSNENMSDALDELFTIRFDVQNQFYNYIKFKAVLSTSDSTITPYLQSYKIKLSS